ncbi:MAG: energy transducer TonB [Bacteroidales bacterium]|nr:energy transducer TonB [Bacteroidales bacterium]MCF8455984.1 energy transducer TonB [Bacteroidales bacterium]
MKLTCLSIIILLSVQSFSQSVVKLYYNDDWELTDSLHSKYYRIVGIDEKDMDFVGEFKDYNNDNQLLMKGFYSNNKKDGAFESYYPNGKIKSKGRYTVNNRNKQWEYYYDNGQLKYIVTFRAGNELLNFNYNFLVSEAFDKEGNKVIENGTGIFKYQYSEKGTLHYYEGNMSNMISEAVLDLITIEGKFIKGKKEGTWSIYYDKQKFFNKDEFFEADSFKYGIVRYQDYIKYGRSEEYNTERIEKLPDEYEIIFKRTESKRLDTTVFDNNIRHSDIDILLTKLTGKVFKIKNRNAGYSEGDYELQELLARNIRYPVDARINGIEGTVYFELIISSKGEVISITKMNSIDKSIDDEALRVISEIKSGWLPTLRDGKEVASKVLIPVDFRLE